MSDDAVHTMTASSAVVLGLLSACGPQTTYEMKSYIEISIGFFWPFPSSQMYAETKRLEAAGLVEAEQEEFGRRRRVLAITDLGRAALEAWLAEPTGRPTEIRDIGLLKLFLSDGQAGFDVATLAREQVALHRARLAEYEQIESYFSGDNPRHETTLTLGKRYEQVAIAFWQDVEQ